MNTFKDGVVSLKWIMMNRIEISKRYVDSVVRIDDKKGTVIS